MSGPQPTDTHFISRTPYAAPAMKTWRCAMCRLRGFLFAQPSRLPQMLLPRWFLLPDEARSMRSWRVVVS